MTGPRASSSGGGPVLRLFCLPYAGGGASVFRDWGHRLRTGVRVVPIELPGRGSRYGDLLRADMAPLVEEAAAAVTVDGSGPFALFGHSMGALIAFEMAHALSTEGWTPVRVFASAHRAPHLGGDGRPVHGLPDEDLLAHLRHLGGIPPSVLADPEILRVMLPIVRADLRVCETYVWKERLPLACPIVAIGGSYDSFVPREDLEAWHVHTASGFRCEMLPSGHFFLNDSLPDLLDLIDRNLADVCQPRGH